MNYDDLHGSRARNAELLRAAIANPNNPIANIEAEEIEQKRRAYYIRRAKFAAAGMLISMAMSLVIVSNMELKNADKEGQEMNKGEGSKNVMLAEISPKKFVSRDRADSAAPRGGYFDGNPEIMQRGTQKTLAHGESTDEDSDLVPTGNSTVPYFPRIIDLPASNSSANISSPTLPAGNSNSIGGTGNKATEPYVLLGLGIRTVSFLSIQVYVVGLYVPQSSLSALQHSLTQQINPSASALIPNEKATLKSSLLDPTGSQEIWSTVLQNQLSPDSSSSSLSTSPIRTALRIVPVRNTDFAHLRDGWVRAITSRTQVSARNGLHEYDDDSFATSVRDFKALFGGKGKAAKGSVMILKRDSFGELEVLMQEEQERGYRGKIETEDKAMEPKYKSLGIVADERIGRLILLGYLAGKDVSSESARRDIVSGIMKLVERPAGTIEAKVE